MSNNNTPEPTLEDFISLSDGVSVDVLAEIVDPLTQRVDEDPEEIEDIEEVIEDPQEDPEEPEEVIEDPLEEEEEVTEDTKEVLKNLFNVLSEDGLLETTEGFEFDGTKESFNTALDQTFESLRTKAELSLLNQLPEDTRAAIKFALTTGKSVKDYYDAGGSDVELENIDISTEDNQRKVLQEYYKKTTQYSSDKIERLINRADQTGELEIEAQEAVQELVNLQEAERETLKTQVEQERAERLQAAEQERNTYREIIENNKELSKIRKDKVRNFIINTTKKRGESQPLNGVVRTIQEAARNPEHFVQLADFLIDYTPERGFSFDRYTSRKATEATRGIQSKINRALAPQDKLRGKSVKTNNQSGSDELKRWLALTEGN